MKRFLGLILLVSMYFAYVMPVSASSYGGMKVLDSGGVNQASVSSGGALKVDGSAATQPVSGSVSVLNFPGVQAVSQNGTWVLKLVDSAGVNVATVSPTGALKIDGSAVTQPVSGTFFQVTQPVSGTFWQATQPVSGTFWQATQPVSGSVSVSNFPASQVISDGGGSITVDGSLSFSPSGTQDVNLVTALTGHGTASGAIRVELPTDGTGQVSVGNFPATQAISAAALPLPAGAATSAKQPALGTAGSAAIDVLSVQGIASMTPLLVNGSGSTQPISGSVSAIQSGTWNIGTLTTITNPVTVTGTVTATPSGTQDQNLTEIAGASVQTGHGLASAALRVELPTDGTGLVQAAQSGTWNITNISGTVSLPTGAATAAKQPALGTAGTASNDVISVQGHAGMTALVVDGSGVTQPVSGTFWQLTQPVSGTFWQATQPVSGTFYQATQPVSGTFYQATQPVSVAATLTVDGSGVTQPVSGTFWQVTQPISAAALPLPTGAATLAKQPALGTAGTASADVISVQGIAAMTPLKVDGSGVTQPVSGTFWQVTQPVSLSGNQAVNLAQVAGATTATGNGTASGAIRVSVASDSTGILALTTGSAQIGHLEANQSSNVAQINGVTPLMGNGASGTGALRVSIANDSTGILALTTSTAQIGHLEANQSSNVAQINGVTPLMGNGASGTGALRVSIANDSTGILALTTSTAQIGHLEANQSSNVAQINGVTPLMGNGASGTGALRVSIANDSTGILALTTSTAQIGHLEANQSSNIAQINGVAPTMGNGAAGTGVQRMTLASDSTGNLATIGTSVTPGTSAAHLGKAEDAGHVTGDTGVMSLCVRNDANATIAGTDLDYSPQAVDAAGHTKIVNEPPLKATYVASTGFYTPPSTPTDCVVVTGSASKTIKILRIELSSIQTATGMNNWFLIKRSAADTTGTATNETLVPLDSSNAASGAGTVKHYTANPGALGAAVGNVLARKICSPVITGLAEGSSVIFDEKMYGQPIVLRGVAEQLALNFGGAAVPAGFSMSVTVWYSEE
jgi:hypothetical protein